MEEILSATRPHLDQSPFSTCFYPGKIHRGNPQPDSREDCLSETTKKTAPCEQGLTLDVPGFCKRDSHNALAWRGKQLHDAVGAVPAATPWVEKTHRLLQGQKLAPARTHVKAEGQQQLRDSVAGRRGAEPVATVPSVPPPAPLPAPAAAPAMSPPADPPAALGSIHHVI